MSEQKEKMIGAILFFLGFMSAPVYGNELTALIGYWGAQGCTEENAGSVYQLDASNTLVNVRKGDKANLKRVFNDVKIIRNPINGDTIVTNESVTDLYTTKTIANIQTISILEDSRRRILEQRVNGNRTVINGLNAKQEQTPWIYKCKAMDDSNLHVVNSTHISVPIQSDDIKEPVCDKKFLNNHKYEIKTEKVKTGVLYKFQDLKPSRIASSIKSVTYVNPHLLIELESKARFPEKVGEIVNVIEKKSYEAQPGTTAAATALTLGLGLIFAPSQTLQSAFGCTDEKLLKKEVSIEDSKETGHYEERNVSSLLEITLTGFGEPQKITLRTSDTQDSVIHKIDLTKWVMQAEISNNSTIIVDCNSCRKQEIEPTIKLSSNNSQAQINADLRPLKEQSLLKVKIENERLAAEEKERQDRALAEAKRVEKIKQAEIAEQKRQEMQRQAEVKQRDEEKKAEEKRILASKEKCLSNGSIGLCSVITIQEGGSVTVVYEGRNNLPQSLNTVRFVCTQFGRDGFPIRSHTLPIAGSFNSKEIKEFKLSVVKDLQFHSIECKLKDWQ